MNPICFALVSIFTAQAVICGNTQGSAKLTTVSKDVGEFYRLVVDRMDENTIVHIIQGPKWNVRIVGEDAAVKKISINSEKFQYSDYVKLILKQTGPVRVSKPTNIYVSGPTIESLVTEGSAKCFVIFDKQYVLNTSLDIIKEGDGDLTVNVKAPKLYLSSYGKGRIVAQGEVKTLDAVFFEEKQTFEGRLLKADTGSVSNYASVPIEVNVAQNFKIWGSPYSVKNVAKA